MHPFPVKKFAIIALLSSFLFTYHVFSSPASVSPLDKSSSAASSGGSPPVTASADNSFISTSLRKSGAVKTGGNQTALALLKSLHAQGIRIEEELRNVNFVKLVSTLAQLVQHSLEGFPAPNDTTTTNPPFIAKPGEVRLSFSLDPRFLSTNVVKFLPFPDRLEQPLNASLVTSLVEKVNQSGLFKSKFIPVPRAFATIVNRAEVEQLSKLGIGVEEITKVARENYIAYTQIYIQCLALDSATTNDGEYLFLRVVAKEWAMTRKDLFGLMKKRLLGKDEKSLREIFNPDLYFPKVVIATSSSSSNSTTTLSDDTFDQVGFNSTKCLALIDSNDDDDGVELFAESGGRNSTNSTLTTNGTLTNRTLSNETTATSTTNGTTSGSSLNGTNFESTGNTTFTLPQVDANGNATATNNSFNDQSTNNAMVNATTNITTNTTTNSTLRR